MKSLTMANMMLKHVGLIYIIILPQLSKGISLTGFSCEQEMFKCDRHTCIPAEWLCDGSPDCKDRSDEILSNCPDGATTVAPACKKGLEFACSNGICIPRDWQCDGVDDCGDFSDETEIGCKSKCESNEFQCKNGQCISSIWRCNGQHDCIDESDEVDCEGRTDRQNYNGKFECQNGVFIPVKWRCDGEVDCQDGSDEENCTKYSITPDHLNYQTLCTDSEFKCPGSFCILNSWVCDGSEDCLFGEDEENCSIMKSSSCNSVNEFNCQDESGCLEMNEKCDGIPQCIDESDELGCSSKDSSRQRDSHRLSTNGTTTKEPYGTQLIQDSTIHTENSTIRTDCDSESYFKCNDHECIPRSKICDGKLDCKEKEDESEMLCGINECSRNNGGCTQECIDQKNGHRCSCFEGYKLVGKYNCIDINECDENPGSCSQLCTNTEGGFRCSCLEGYVKDHVNFTRCKAAEGEVYLLFSNSYDIRRLRLSDRDMTAVVEGTRSAIALDYLFEDGKLLWSDKKDKKIYRANISDTSSREVLAESLDISADGLAVDWVHRNIYYTDTVRSAVHLLNWEATFFKTLVHENLSHPRAIAVAPLKGFIYWTDWGIHPKIERSALDGSERTEIVSRPHVVWPNGLTIDTSADRLYWCDGRQRTISSVNLDGTDMKVVLYSSEYLKQPFSISVFEDRLYWTDWSQMSLLSANKFTGSNIHNVSAGHFLESPKVVHVYHEYRQPRGENVCLGHTCSHFCMRNLKGTEMCSCADGFDLGSDGKSCFDEGESKKSERYAPEAEGIEIKPFYQEIFLNHHRGLIIGIFIGIFVIFGVGLGFYLIWSRKQPMDIKSVRFDNSVYRKTTFEEEQGFSHPLDQVVSETTKVNRHIIPIKRLSEADDAPLTLNAEDFDT